MNFGMAAVKILVTAAFPLQLLHRLCQPQARGGMNTLAVEKSFNCMLEGAGFPSKLPEPKAFRSEYQCWIGGVGLGRLARFISDRTLRFECAYVFAFLRLALNLLTNKVE